jgi:hypothetical protein
MTKRFWYHLVLCAALFSGANLFVRLTGYARPGSAPPPAPETPAVAIAVYLATLAFLYVFARLALRVSGSDRTTGLLSVYAVSLFVPFVAAVTGSFATPLVLLLIAAAALEIVDVDLARVGAVRSGLYVSAAWIIEPGCAVIAAALVPVVIIAGRRRWTLTLRYLVAAVIPWVAYHWFRGGIAAGWEPLREAVLSWDHRTAVAVLSTGAGWIRTSWEGDLSSTYAAFGLAGLLGGTVRRLGPSRRGVFTIAWLVAVSGAATALGDGSARVFRPLLYALLVLLAGAGLASIAAMNPLHAGRRRTIPAGVFFLLPQVVVWAKLLF